MSVTHIPPIITIPSPADFFFKAPMHFACVSLSLSSNTAAFFMWVCIHVSVCTHVWVCVQSCTTLVIVWLEPSPIFHWGGDIFLIYLPEFFIHILKHFFSSYLFWVFPRFALWSQIRLWHFWGTNTGSVTCPSFSLCFGSVVPVYLHAWLPDAPWPPWGQAFKLLVFASPAFEKMAMLRKQSRYSNTCQTALYCISLGKIRS